MAREHAKKDQEEVEQVECGICRKDFNSEAELKRHSWYCKNKEDIALKRKQAKEAKLGVNAVSPALSTGSMSSVSTGASTGSGGRPIKDKTCPYCLDPFASMQSRNRHIANKHPEKKNDVETTTVQYFKIDSVRQTERQRDRKRMRQRDRESESLTTPNHQHSSPTSRMPV